MLGRWQRNATEANETNQRKKKKKRACSPKADTSASTFRQLGSDDHAQMRLACLEGTKPSHSPFVFVVYVSVCVFLCLPAIITS